jgi:hypothetical protein
MSVYSGPNTIKDSLVFSIDPNNFKSFKGTTPGNLAYTNGITDWSMYVSNYVTRQTIEPDYRYQLNTGSIYTAGRFIFNLFKLNNGRTYTLSFKWRPITPNAQMLVTDWCDQSLSRNIVTKFDNYTSVEVSSSRSSYDTTYNFMDFEMSLNSTVEIWDFQLEEGSIGTAFNRANVDYYYDLSLNQNSALIYGKPEFTSNELIFSPNNYPDFVQFPNSSFLNFGPNENFTIDMWIKTTENASSRKPLAKKNVDGLDVGWGFYQSAGSLFVKITNGVSSICETSISSMNDGSWHNLVYSFERSNTLSMYKDGVLVGTQSISSWATTDLTNSNPLVIGGHTPLDPGGFFIGRIGQINIYKKAFSNTEVLQNYLSLRNKYGI